MSLVDVFRYVWQKKSILLWVNAVILVLSFLSVQFLPKWREDVLFVVGSIDGKFVMQDKRVAAYIMGKYGEKGVTVEEVSQDGYLVAHAYNNNSSELKNLVGELSKDTISMTNELYTSILENNKLFLADWESMYQKTCVNDKNMEMTSGTIVIGQSPCVAIMKEMQLLRKGLNNESTYPSSASIYEIRSYINYLKITVFSLALGFILGMTIIFIIYLFDMTRISQEMVATDSTI